MEYIAKTMAGLESVLAEELLALGAQDVQPAKRAVQFTGDLQLMYRANFELRTALRILQPIADFTANDDKSLYHRISEIDWSAYFGLDDTFAIDAVVNSPVFRHSQYVALNTKDAIADQFRRLHGQRPSVDTRQPNVRIHIHVFENRFNLALDSSGESLHRRGYRADALEAPLNEVLAAGLIALSGWQADCTFLDPMCGSGTILMEAALLANKIPPQWRRSTFGFTGWKNFDPELWAAVKAEAMAKRKTFHLPIMGYDRDPRAINRTTQNAKAAGLSNKISVHRTSFELLEPPPPPGIVIMNPPYDERLGVTDVEELYEMIGSRFKHAFAGYQAWLISSNMPALKKIGLRPSRKYTVFNGPLECRYLGFDLYEGSKKQKEEKQENHDS